MPLPKYSKGITFFGARIQEDDDHKQWFTTEAVGEIPIEIVPREGENDWIKRHAVASSVPFEFETQPAIRFILIQSAEVSELIILCHHIICDGMSLAYLARDLMAHMGNPNAEVEVLPEAKPITLENLPQDINISAIVKYFINKIRGQWVDENTFFDQEDYRSLTRTYWEHFNHEVVSIELSEEETSALVARCKKEKVTVNSAITTAFSGAQGLAENAKPYHARTAIGVSLRDRLPNSPGESIGYYAGGVELNLKYNHQKRFWENPRSFHRKIKRSYTNKKTFAEILKWQLMDSNIYEAMNFKKLGGLIPSGSPGFEKLSAFSRKEDVVTKLLQRVNMETFETKLLGPAVTNLGRMDFPAAYGALELDRLIMQPGGAFPLAHVNLVVGVVTCAGKLSLVVEYAREAVDPETIGKIKKQAIDYLLGG